MEGVVVLVMVLGFFGTLILRPITKRLGLLIEATAQERRARVERRPDDESLARVASLLERLDGRIDLLEDRIEFTERLLEARPPRRAVRAAE